MVVIVALEEALPGSVSSVVLSYSCVCFLSIAVLVNRNLGTARGVTEIRKRSAETLSAVPSLSILRVGTPLFLASAKNHDLTTMKAQAPAALFKFPK